MNKNTSGIRFFRNLAACLLALFFLLSLPVQADIYKWVDEKGQVHYSDAPPQAIKDEASLEIMPSAPPSDPPPAKAETETPAADAPAPQPEAKKEAPKTTPVVELFVTDWCKYCKLAENFLKKNKIAFTVYNVEKDAQAAKRRRSLDPRPGVPLAVINGKTLLGFSEAHYRQALGLD